MFYHCNTVYPLYYDIIYSIYIFVKQLSTDIHSHIPTPRHKSPPPTHPHTHILSLSPHIQTHTHTHTHTPLLVFSPKYENARAGFYQYGKFNVLVILGPKQQGRHAVSVHKTDCVYRSQHTTSCESKRRQTFISLNTPRVASQKDGRRLSVTTHYKLRVKETAVSGSDTATQTGPLAHVDPGYTEVWYRSIHVLMYTNDTGY